MVAVDKILMEVHHNLVAVLIKLVEALQEIKVDNILVLVAVEDQVEVL